jgi:hypothetical protein
MRNSILKEISQRQGMNNLSFDRRRAWHVAMLMAGSIVAAPLAYAANPVDFHIVDASTGKPIPDATVTINGSVLPVDAGGHYAIPAKAQAIMARAPGYKAATFAVGDASKNNGNLALTPFMVKALYLSEYGVASRPIRDAALNIIHHGGANALVINIKSDHGMLVYPSDIALAKTIGARKLTTIGSLREMVNAGHGQGIYMIARIVTFKDNPLATSRPDLAIHLSSGALFKDREHLSWADPTQPEVRAYNIAIGVEAAQAGFDEVQYDYVRFPDATTKLKFHGPTDEASRVATITGFLRDAHAALAPYNVFHSADIFGYVSWNKNDTGIGQQLEEAVKVVDYACPMLYPSGFKYGLPGHPKPMANTEDIYNTIKLTLDKSVERTNVNPKKFRPWLQAFRDYAFGGLIFGPTEVAAQTRAAADAHADGWQLWNPHNRYTDIGLIEVAAPKPAPKADAAKKK